MQSSFDSLLRAPIRMTSALLFSDFVIFQILIRLWVGGYPESEGFIPNSKLNEFPDGPLLYSQLYCLRNLHRRAILKHTRLKETRELYEQNQGCEAADGQPLFEFV